MKKAALLLCGTLALASLAQAQTVTKFAGSVGIRGGLLPSASSPLNSAQFADPANLTVDANGRMWIVEQNRVRMIQLTPTPTVYNRAGDPTGSSGNSDGSTPSINRFDMPTGIAVAKDSFIYIVDYNNNCIRRLDKFFNTSNPQPVVTYAGTNSPVGGFADGAQGVGQLDHPVDIVVDASNNLYISDSYNNCIRKVDATGALSVLVGNSTAGDLDGVGSAARLHTPTGLAWYGNDLLVVDFGNRKIKRINITTKTITTIAGGSAGIASADGDALTQATFTVPNDLAVDANMNIYVTEGTLGNDTINVIRKITGSCVTTFAGTKGSAGSTDGSGAAARFNNPTGITFSSGSLFVCDQDNQTLRMVTSSTVLPDPAPVATFSSALLTGDTTTVFSFHDSTSQPVNSRVWRFSPNSVTYVSGDSSSKDIQVRFNTKAVSYTVSLEVKNCMGVNTKTRTNYISISNPTPGVNEVGAERDFAVFPNPTAGVFEVSASKGQLDMVRVMDLSGKVVYELQTSGAKASIDMTAFAKGMYILQISGKNSSVTKKLVIE